jgi:sugar phosphate isomerase/epimerase
VQLAVQLYTLRHKLEQDLEGTFAQLSEAGVTEVELAGFYDRPPPEFRAALDAAGLKAVAGHVPFEGLERAPDNVLEVAEIVGTETIVLPWVPAPQTAAEADEMVERIVKVKDAITEGGRAFAYHNHDFEFRELDDGADFWSRLKAAGLNHEPDVGWLVVAGRDPVAEIGDLQGRCPLVHAKDVRQKADGTWEDVIAGDGEIDWSAIVTAAIAAGATRIVVELDNPSELPVDDVTLSLAALRDALP